MVDGDAPSQQDGHPPEEGYLFVVTYGRSGSTVLMNVLNAIPGVVVRGENMKMCHHLRKLVDTVAYGTDFKVRRAEAALAPDARSPYWRRILGTPADPWFGAERIDPDAMGQALCDAFVRTVLTLPAGTRLGGFKEVRYNPDLIVDDLDFLRRFFPGARFLFLTRDHNAVMASGWYVMKSRIVMSRRLRAADAAFARYAEDHPGICHSIRYEDFSDDPEALRPLFVFLDEPFDRDAVAAILARRLTHLKTSRQPKITTRIRNAALRQLHLVQVLMGR